MKQITTILICLVLALCAVAQTQQGYVKTRGRLGTDGKVIAGQPLSGVTVQVKGRTAVVSRSNGTFSTVLSTNKFFLQSVKKKGYVLSDPEVLTRQYAYSANPIVIVLETPSQQTEDKLANERKIRRTLQRQLEAKENEIESLKEQNKITQEDYQQRLKRLYAEQQSNERLISQMAERYAQIDYDQLDEFNLRISDCILNGRLTEADSLLRSKGDISTRIVSLNQHHEANLQAQASLEKSKAMEARDREDIARDCYNFYQKFLVEHLNDSASHYLELRADLDTTNIKWQNEAGTFLEEYLSDYPRALEYYQRGLRQAIVQYGENSEWAATMINNIGYNAAKRGDYDSALEFYQRALAICQQQYGPEDEHVAIAYNNIGGICDVKGKYAQALEAYQKAFDIFLKVKGLDHNNTAKSYQNIGATYYRLGQYDEALNHFLQALSIRERILSPDNPSMAISYSNIGLVYQAKEDFDKALEYYQKALQLQEKVLNDAHPDLASTYNKIGTLYNKQGDYEKALEFLTKSLAINLKTLGTNHPSTAMAYNNVGMVYSSMGDHNKALEYLIKGLEIHRQKLGPDHLTTAQDYNNIGLVYDRLGDDVHALEYYQNALSIREQKLGPEHQFTALSYSNIAKIYARINNDEKALEYYTKAYNGFLKSQGPENSNTIQVKEAIDKIKGQSHSENSN